MRISSEAVLYTSEKILYFGSGQFEKNPVFWNWEFIEEKETSSSSINCGNVGAVETFIIARKKCVVLGYNVSLHLC